MSTSAEPTTPWGLTPREIDVMDALCVYGNNKATALALSLSPSTVETYLREASKRMGVEERMLMALSFQRWRLGQLSTPGVERQRARRYVKSRDEKARRDAIMAAAQAAPATGITLPELRAIVGQDLRTTLFRMRADGVLHFVQIGPRRFTYFPTAEVRDAAALALAEASAAPRLRGHPEAVVRNAIRVAVAAAPEDVGIELAQLAAATGLSHSSLKMALCRMRKDGQIAFLRVSMHRSIYFPTAAARDVAMQGLPQRLAAEAAERAAAKEAARKAKGGRRSNAGRPCVQQDRVRAALASAPTDGLSLEALHEAIGGKRYLLLSTLNRMRSTEHVFWLALTPRNRRYFPTAAARDTAQQLLDAAREAAKVLKIKAPKPVKAAAAPAARMAALPTTAPRYGSKPIKAPEVGITPRGPAVMPPGFEPSKFPTPLGRYEVPDEPIEGGFRAMGIGRYLKDRT